MLVCGSVCLCLFIFRFCFCLDFVLCNLCVKNWKFRFLFDFEFADLMTKKNLFFFIIYNSLDISTYVHVLVFVCEFTANMNHIFLENVILSSDFNDVFIINILNLLEGKFKLIINVIGLDSRLCAELMCQQGTCSVHDSQRALSVFMIIYLSTLFMCLELQNSSQDNDESLICAFSLFMNQHALLQRIK